MRVKPRALVVDADPVVRLAIDRQLEAVGWDAYAANNGAEAIQMLKLRLRFDAVLASCDLPDLAEDAMLAAARELSPAAGIIVLCNKPAVRPGILCLVKPFSTVSLAETLRMVQAGRQAKGGEGSYPR